MYSQAIDIARHLMGVSTSYNPFSLCEQLDIPVITDRELNKDGYLVCSDGQKLIFVNSKIQNKHRQKFVIAHEVGHFLMHQDQMYGCSNVSLSSNAKVNTSHQERDANAFATELLAPIDELRSLIPNSSLRLSDISGIADFFDISMSHAAIKCVQNSKAENEVLLCYNGDKLKWYVTKGSYNFRNRIPTRCPINVCNIAKAAYVNGIWDDLFEGSVYQEVFHPYGNQSLVLLSGNMIDEEGYYEF